MNIVVKEKADGTKKVELTQSKKEEQAEIICAPGERLVAFCDTSELYTRYPQLKQVDAFLLTGFGEMLRAKEIIGELLTIAFDLGKRTKETAESVKTAAK